MVYSTVTVTSVKGFTYAFVLVSVSSQRVFWLAVVLGVDAEDVNAATEAEAVVGLDGLTVVGEARVVDLPTTVVDVDVEDVTDDVVADCARRGLVVVVEDGATAPKKLSSAALVQGWPLISDRATRRT